MVAQPVAGHGKGAASEHEYHHCQQHQFRGVAHAPEKLGMVISGCKEARVMTKAVVDGKNEIAIMDSSLNAICKMGQAQDKMYE